MRSNAEKLLLYQTFMLEIILKLVDLLNISAFCINLLSLFLFLFLLELS